MSQCTDNPSKILRLEDLPLELFQRILRECFLARDLARGLRLRLVNRLFSYQIHHVLFLYNMLDAPLSLRSGRRLPPFTASYIENRVKKEASQGNPKLICIRLIAERLTTESQTVEQNIKSLCELSAPNVSYIFSPHRGPSEPLCHNYFDSLSQVAAVHLNHDARFDSRVVPKSDYEFFGSFEDAAVKSGSLELLELCMRRASSASDVYKLLRAAELHGGIDEVRCIYDHDGKGNSYLRNARRVARAMRTSRPEIMDYVMEKQREYGHPNQTWWLKAYMKRCVQNGWTDMARHVLKVYGTRLQIRPRPADETYLYYAASGGHVEIVKLLLDRDTTSRNSGLKAAALNGHDEVFRLLYSQHQNDATNGVTGALVAAAKGGHLNIVKILLEGGADANESDGDLPAICYALLNEHTAMYQCLIEHGASVPTLELCERCTSWAK